jgi:hypothetical protein
MNPSKYLIPILLILLLIAVLTSTIFYTFRVGSIKPEPAASVNPNSTASSIPGPKPEDQYPDQAHITDRIILFGLIIMAIILFDIAWGRQMTNRSVPKPPRR